MATMIRESHWDDTRRFFKGALIGLAIAVPVDALIAWGVWDLFVR